MEQDSPADSRGPVNLRIKFRSENLDQFIERYGIDVSRGGIFIRTREPLAVGTPLRFDFQLQDSSPLISGEGTVVWIREYDESRAGVTPGMGVRFDKLNPTSQPVLERILAEKSRRDAAPGAPAKGAGIAVRRSTSTFSALDPRAKASGPGAAPAPGAKPATADAGSAGPVPSAPIGGSLSARIAAVQAGKAPPTFSAPKPGKFEAPSSDDIDRALDNLTEPGAPAQPQAARPATPSPRPADRLGGPKSPGETAAAKPGAAGAAKPGFTGAGNPAAPKPDDKGAAARPGLGRTGTPGPLSSLEKLGLAKTEPGKPAADAEAAARVAAIMAGKRPSGRFLPTGGEDPAATPATPPPASAAAPPRTATPPPAKAATPPPAKAAAPPPAKAATPPPAAVTPEPIFPDASEPTVVADYLPQPGVTIPRQGRADRTDEDLATRQPEGVLSQPSVEVVPEAISPDEEQTVAMSGGPEMVSAAFDRNEAEQLRPSRGVVEEPEPVAPSGPLSVDEDAATPMPERLPPPAPAPARRKRRPVGAIVLVAVVLASVTGLALVNRARRAREASPPSPPSTVASAPAPAAPAPAPVAPAAPAVAPAAPAPAEPAQPEAKTTVQEPAVPPAGPAKAEAPKAEEPAAAREEPAAEKPGKRPARPAAQSRKAAAPKRVAGGTATGEQPAEGAATTASGGAAAAPIVHSLRIVTLPSGADVTIDGEPAGKTPFTKKGIDISSSHTIVVKKDGYEPQEHQVSGGQWTSDSGELETYKLTLKLQKTGGGETKPDKAAADKPAGDKPAPEGEAPKESPKEEAPPAGE